jgi:putative aldouronate transport system substrate-binding protein
MLPENQFGYSRGLYIDPHQLNRIWAVSVESKQIDAIMEMFNWFYTDEACDLMNLGIEGEDYIYSQNGEIQITEQVVKKYSNENSTFVPAMMHKERGNAAYQSFLPYTDLHAYFISINPIQLGYYRIQQQDTAFTFPVPTPSLLNEEQREKSSAIFQKLNTISAQMFDKLISGMEPIGEFENYVKQFKDAGMDELERIYNEAYNKVIQ